VSKGKGLRVDSNKSRLESKQRGSTHIASSKFFSAMALLPSALSASAISRYDTRNSLGLCSCLCDFVGKSALKGELGTRLLFRR
jgi:hypothetical protein